MRWHSLHVFRHDGQEDLLVDCLEPLVRTLREEGKISRCFFLRYWICGPHIRLRLLVPDDHAPEQVLATATAAISAYFAAHPNTSSLSAADYEQMKQRLGALEQVDVAGSELAPDDSVRLEEYPPEYSKYGGVQGTEIAEQVFDLSTRCVFRVLPELRKVRSRRLSVGFTMMLVGMRSFGLSPEEMLAFLDWYSQVWGRYSPIQTAELWAQKLEAQQASLQQRARTILAGEPLQHPTFAEWGEGMHHAAAALRASSDEVLPAVTIGGEHLPAQRKRELLLMNYLHTNNNRLNVLTVDEAYLAFLGKCTLESLLR
jgi:thiopeptide-type bacteriocin biosynthesis protein